MPNDPYQISDTDSGITLVLSDRGVGVAATHAATHVGAGADAIREATAAQNGLMSAAYATKLDGVEAGAQLTNAARIASAIGGAAVATPANEDSIAFLDASDTGALKTATLSTLGTYLGGSLVTLGSTQTIAGTKTFTQANINGGLLSGVSLSSGNQISLTANTLSGALPVTNGGTGQTAFTAGDLLYSPATNTLGKLAAAATGNVLLSGTAPSWGKVALTTHVSGVLPVANGGTGATAATGTGSVVLASNPVLVAPNLGTPVAGSTLTNCVGLPLTTGVSGVLPVTNGGTGYNTNSYGQLSSQIAAPSSVDYTTTYEAVNLDTTLGSGLVDFDGGSPTSDNTLRYTGTTPRKFLIFASLDMASPATGAYYSIKLARISGITTTLIDESRCDATSSGKVSTFIAKLICSWVVELSTNDVVRLYVGAPNAGAGVEAGTPQRMRLIATPV